MQKTRLLLTGATGFLGSRFLNKIDRNRFDVSKLSVDLTHPDEITRAVSSLLPEIVVHAGALVDLSRDFSIGKKCLEVNTLGTMNLLEAVKNAAHIRFIYVSTEEVYGNGPIPFTETQPVDPPSPYAISKVAGEHLCLWYAKEYGFSTVVARLGTFYGPEQPMKKYFAQTILHALKNEPIPLNSGKKKRDYVYVDDAIECMMRLLDIKENVVLNIAGGVSFSLHEIVQRIIRLTKSTSEVQIGAIDDRITERDEWLADIGLAKQLVGWTPTTSLDEGLKTTVEYFRSII
jgi:nucleoside-diphosphate-sugar epimerase